MQVEEEEAVNANDNLGLRLIWGTTLEQGTTLERNTLVRILVSRNGHLSAGDEASRVRAAPRPKSKGVPWA